MRDEERLRRRRPWQSSLGGGVLGLPTDFFRVDGVVRQKTEDGRPTGIAVLVV
jgi:hypothetical protein